MRLPKRPKKQWPDDDGEYTREERRRFLYRSSGEMRLINEKADAFHPDRGELTKEENAKSLENTGKNINP
jgi:hypothetical protein